MGKIRHLDVRRLWIQEKAKEGTIGYMRVSRSGHVVDSFTKAATKHEMEAALAKLNPTRPKGRPMIAPQLNNLEDNTKWQKGQEYERKWIQQQRNRDETTTKRGQQWRH